MARYTWQTKRAEELKKEIIKNVFFYSITNNSEVRGDNRTINLFVIKKDYQPVEIANYSVNTASYKGDRAIASNMISEIFGHKMKDGYIILRSFSCSDMLNLDKVSYYDDLSTRDKNILDNCDEIKLNINNVSYDFISPVGILNINIKNK